MEYCAGKQNKVADALSCRLEDQPSLASLSMPHLPLFYYILTEIQNSDQLQLLKKNKQQDKAIGPWEYKDIHSLRNRFPSFELENKCRINGSGDVMSSHMDKFSKGQVY